MDVQLVLVLECDEKSRSDYMYIKSVLDEWYKISMSINIKISSVFMRGKGNYKKKDVFNKIEKLQKAYMHGNTKVLFCFDTDRYEIAPADKQMLVEEQEYCKEKGYEFVWFCHDIEEVFLGKSVSKNEKTDKAKQYISNGGVKQIKIQNLQADDMSKGKSNLVYVLQKCLSCADSTDEYVK